ncbi:MAG: SURF1 family protein [Actinomycetota bacterium]
MTKIKVSSSKASAEEHPYLISLIAIALIALCLWASQWQFQRGVDRHHRNFLISQHVEEPPMSLDSIVKNIDAHEWNQVETTGRFDSSHQILLRNKYFEGKYGFNLLTLFTETNGKTFWVNRGWIAPGASAEATPLTPKTPSAELKIKGTLRLDNSLPQGSFFAMPQNGGNLIEKWNAQGKNSLGTQPFYIDLVSASLPEATPKNPVELPELSDGPHMAYALQWIFFAGLVIYGRILLRRGR